MPPTPVPQGNNSSLQKSPHSRISFYLKRWRNSPFGVFIILVLVMFVAEPLLIHRFFFTLTTKLSVFQSELFTDVVLSTILVVTIFPVLYFLVYRRLVADSEKFLKITETIPDAVIMVALDGNVVFWNKAAEAIFGYTRTEMLGQGVYALISAPEVVGIFERELKNFEHNKIGQQTDAPLKVTATRKNGERFSAEISVSKSFIDGEWYVVGVVRDVTRREQAIEKLRENEGFLAKLLDTIPVPVFYKDRIGRYLGFNSAYEKFFGATKEKLVGKTVFDINPPELAVVYNAKDSELFEKGGVQQYESQVKSLDKGLRDVVFSKAVFTDKNGSAAGLVGAILDITENKKAQEIIREGERGLRDIIENSPIATIVNTVVNGKEELFITNKEFTELFGYTAQDIPDMEHWWTAAYPDEAVRQTIRANFTEALTQASRSNVKIIPIETSVVCKDGTSRYVRMSMSSFSDKNIVTFQDLTDRKLSDKEREAALKFVESMDKVNKAILSTDDLDEMMCRVLDVVLDVMGSDRAWLITPVDPWTLYYRVPMERTRPEYPGASTSGIEVPVDPDTTILFQKLRANDGPVEFNTQTDPPLPPEITKHFQVQSQIAMDIYPKAEESWAFGVHQCSYERFWTKEEKRLFQEIGRRITDALTTLLARRELEKREEEYRRIITTTTEGVIVIDKEQKFTFVNPQMVQMLGYQERELLGHKFEEFLLEEELADHKKQMEERSRGNTTVYNRRFRRKDGNIIWCRVSGTPIFDDKQEYNGSFAMITDITERKMAEQELRESESKFSAAFQASPSLIAITRLSDGKIIDVNDGWTRMLGYSRDESLGKTTIELSIWANPSDRDILVSNLKNSGQVPNFETTFRRKDGVVITGLYSGKIFKLKNEDCILSVAYDISGRKESEQELLEEERYSQSLLRFSRKVEQSQMYGEVLTAAQEEIKTIMGYTNVWAYRVDEKKEYAHSIVAAGSSAEAVMSEEGSATLRIPGDPMLEAIASAKEIVIVEDALTDPNVNREIVEKMKNRTIVNVPIILFDKNLGSIGMGTFGDEGVKVPTKHEQEYLIAMASHMAVAFDRIRLLDERKKTEEVLRENEIKLKEAQRIGQFGNFEWDSRTNEAVWSQEFFRIYGLDPKQKAPTLEEYIKMHTPESATIMQQATEGLRKTGEPYSIDLEVKRPDGTRRWINLRAEAKYDDNHNFIGARGTGQDITRAKEVEKMRVDFLLLASHQLRTPLSGTKWLIETLEKGLPGPLTKGQEEYLNEVHKINERMTRLVSDMLVALRVESTESVITKKAVSIPQLFSDLMLSAEAAAKSRGIVIRDDSARHPVPRIESDMNFLSIILSTFLSNAINYSEDGKEVIFDVVAEDGGAALSIRDFGIGIPPDEQNHVYERFFRAVNAKTVRPEGTGLGLYIANILASKLGGRITFTSELGKGTTFTLHLPASTKSTA